MLYVLALPKAKVYVFRSLEFEGLNSKGLAFNALQSSTFTNASLLLMVEFFSLFLECQGPEISYFG